MKKILNILLVMFICSIASLVGATNLKIDAVYPYSLDKNTTVDVFTNSTQPLFLNIENYDNPQVENVILKITLPAGLVALEDGRYQVTNENGKTILSKPVTVSANYGINFDLIYLRATEENPLGKQEFKVEVLQANKVLTEKTVTFNHVENTDNIVVDSSELVTIKNSNINNEENINERKKRNRKTSNNKKFNWYVKAVELPVDSQGKKDPKVQDGTIVVRDVALEGFRNRITGSGATNWAAVYNTPVAYLLLDMRNPQMDTLVLRFKAELIEKESGKVVPGLTNGAHGENDVNAGWSSDVEDVTGTTAMISLDGKKNQEFILPIYIDQFHVIAGEYNLRITVENTGGLVKVQELPLRIVKSQNIALFAVGFAIICLIIICLNLYRLKKIIIQIGAKGAITIALFAAVAFGAIVVPTTIIGDIAHVILGPFSGFITGILNGIFMYILIVSLLVIYRKPGVITLMFLLKWALAGLMFGRFTPIGLLNYSVNIVVLEAVVYFSGFYFKEKLSGKYMLFVAILLGLADGFITMINLEQLMFFYRLYYADWYIGLYMLINGLLYSSIGAWLGYKVGSKLTQVMGE